MNKLYLQMTAMPVSLRVNNLVMTQKRVNCIPTKSKKDVDWIAKRR